MTADFMFIHQTLKTGETINALLKELRLDGRIDFGVPTGNYNQVLFSSFWGPLVFRRARLIMLFDLVVFMTGTALLFALLGWTNVEATVVQAENVCEYSILGNQSSSTDSLASLQVISGKCVETEEAAKQLIKAGYNHVAKGWMATAMIKNEAKPTEVYLFDAGYQATNKSWELFLWGERKLEIGCTIRLNRTSTGYIVIPPTYPLTIGDIFWALYQTIIGLILSFGTLAIYIFKYLRASSQKRD